MYTAQQINIHTTLQFYHSNAFEPLFLKKAFQYSFWPKSSCVFGKRFINPPNVPAYATSRKLNHLNEIRMYGKIVSPLRAANCYCILFSYVSS